MGTVTRPVTQVALVAVKSASRYGTLIPFEELMGRDRAKLPRNMVIKKLSKMICVVENLNFFFLII